MARPLTKRNRNGLLYARPAGIETNIDAALVQDLPVLMVRTKQTNTNAADFLASECLVHLIRESIRTKDFEAATKLMPVLLRRCEKGLLGTVPDRRWRNAEEIREAILSDFALLFTDDSDGALDFYECKFASAFSTLRIDHVRRAMKESKDIRDLPEPSPENMMIDDSLLARLSRMAAVGPSQEDAAYLPQVLAAIDNLPPPEKETFVLRRLNCLTEKEAAAICRVDERTIRNRLARADEKLITLKEDL